VLIGTFNTVMLINAAMLVSPHYRNGRAIMLTALDSSSET
jgi:hypothetical protein